MKVVGVCQKMDLSEWQTGSQEQCVKYPQESVSIWKKWLSLFTIYTTQLYVLVRNSRSTHTPRNCEIRKTPFRRNVKLMSFLECWVCSGGKEITHSFPTGSWRAHSPSVCFRPARRRRTNFGYPGIGKLLWDMKALKEIHTGDKQMSFSGTLHANHPANIILHRT